MMAERMSSCPGFGFLLLPPLIINTTRSPRLSTPTLNQCTPTLIQTTTPRTYTLPGHVKPLHFQLITFVPLYFNDYSSDLCLLLF